MQHLVPYKIFENEVLRRQKYYTKTASKEKWHSGDHPNALMEDDEIQKWLKNVKVVKFGGSPFDEVETTIITPYGEQISVQFEHSRGPEMNEPGSYTETCYFQDDWGILYTIPGYNNEKYFDHVEDIEWEWDPDQIKAEIAWGFDPINFIEKAWTKDPRIALRVYDLLPEDKRKEATEIFTRSGANLGSVRKGIKLLRGLGSI